MNIIIIGATGGIGNCLSHDLSTNHNLYIGSKNQEKVDTLINDINVKSNHNVSGSKLEASDFESIKEFLFNANNYLGSIDCIINCVGSLLLKPAHTTSEEELENIFKTNVFSCFGILKHSFKFLRNNGGSLIFFSSAASKVGLKNHEAIASAKAAVWRKIW